VTKHPVQVRFVGSGDAFGSGGLPFLVLDGQFARRTRPLHVAGPAGVGERVQAAMEVLVPGSTQIQRRFPYTSTN
jgi:hypothetical protein